jgi:hypothetical protein
MDGFFGQSACNLDVCKQHGKGRKAMSILIFLNFVLPQNVELPLV